jgi:ubiquinone/menaquinone biosynthesis C-methylase UbiE
MPQPSNPIVETYSRLAKQYDDDLNMLSCWGRATQKALASIALKQDYRVVVDMGCGPGRALTHLASSSRPEVRFIGIDPAENMRQLAAKRTANLPNAVILDGCFERIPLESDSVDYLYSILAFHWTTDLDGSARELARVLKPTGEMDLFFIGRNNGREFIQKTTPIFLRYMGVTGLLDSARMRKQLTREEALQLFSKLFGASRLSVEESYDTYYDSLEGHWAWWVRIEGQFLKIPPEKRHDCDGEVKAALESLTGEHGISYTIHQLHVRVGQA